MFGFINLNKPVGPTSHDCVYAVRRLVGRHVKVGHAGTLDPFAEGVLVICLGHARRLAEYVQRQPKRYRAGIQLGATSSTDDCHGQITLAAAAQPPSLETVRGTLGQFVGEIHQIPPEHSAINVNVRRAYTLARAGKPVQLAARPVRIYELGLIRYDYPLLEVEVHCGSGTYVRSLARDIGAALGVGGYCQTLIRTQVGPFRVEQASAVSAIDIRRDLHAPLEALGLPVVRLDYEAIQNVLQGRRVPVDAVPDGNELAATDDLGRLLAIVRPEAYQGQWELQPLKVFPLP